MSHFKAPYLPTTLVFRLDVSDGYYTRSATVAVTVTPALDSDGDGMPDRWEELYPGSLNPLVKDGDLDSDHDGGNNLAEYLQGTDPTDPGSNFQAVIHPIPAGMRVEFSTVPGHHYQVQQSQDLCLWTPMAGAEDFAATSSQTMIDDNQIITGSNFYRIAVIPSGY
jgi:hypothetical protein